MLLQQPLLLLLLLKPEKWLATLATFFVFYAIFA